MLDAASDCLADQLRARLLCLGLISSSSRMFACTNRLLCCILIARGLINLHLRRLRSPVAHLGTRAHSAPRLLRIHESTARKTKGNRTTLQVCIPATSCRDDGPLEQLQGQSATTTISGDARPQSLAGYGILKHALVLDRRPIHATYIHRIGDTIPAGTRPAVPDLVDQLAGILRACDNHTVRSNVQISANKDSSLTMAHKQRPPSARRPLACIRPLSRRQIGGTGVATENC